ncbi:hypothetical protein HPB52_023774 [Rhipicephalus sanguineus]|uniref:Tick transposon n=1 Tax=Rhipicephalus sanguineus TaxID=34632 RepID=A0A9D4T281_RHISA|nr:hypothetical protein HPB52_023774 [Rhipicephalus sanguineus]
MTRTNTPFAVACDPHKPGGSLPKLPEGFTAFACAKDPSAIILARRPPFDVCPMYATKFVVAVYCQSTDSHFTLISAYAPPHKPLDPILRALEDVVARSRSPNIVLAGDLNANHLAWGPRAGDDRGARVVEFAAAAGLVFLNDPASEPTYETAYAASWIDVTLATPSALAAGYTWQVHLDETFSEHKLIDIHIGDTRNEPRRRLTRYAQSELLSTLARETWFARVTQSQPASSEALEFVPTKFYSVFNRHLTRHLRPAKARTGGNSWWTPDLALERKRVNATRRRFQRCSDPLLRPVLRQEYTESLARFRRNVQVAKRSYETEQRFSRPYREAFGKTRSPCHLPPLERDDGTLTSTHLEYAALLLETQIAVDSPGSDKSCHAATRQLATAPYASPVQDVPFTETEVADVIDRMSPRSSPGPDSITPLLMRGLFRAQRKFVLMVLNTALRLGYFPRCWRSGRIIFIPKPGRPPQRTTSYRPICVTSIFGKTLERLLNARLYYFLWHNGYVHENQFGFTHSRSAVVALDTFKTRLLQLKASKVPAILMSLDFQGAFDSAWHPLVLKFFRDRGLAHNLYHLLRTFLHDRSVVFTSHAGQLTAHPSLGSPQGSPLSPMLWNIIIYDLLCLPMPPGVTVQAYAEDAIIFIPAKSCERLGELGSAVLKSVIDCTERAKVKLSKEKAYCVLFSHGQGGMEKVRSTVRLNPTDRSLAYKDTLRILGVVFDRRLSFFAHADHLREKTEALVAKLGALAHMQGRHLRPMQKVRLYRSVLLPAITYASPVWWDELRPDCRLRSRLVSLQRTVLLTLIGAYRTTRTTALQVLMRASPITLELAWCNAEYHLLIARKPVRFGDAILHPDRVLYAPDTWSDHPAQRLRFPFSRLSRQDAKTLATTPGTHIYTDGSYSSRCAGAAFVVLRSQERIGAVGRYKVEDATSAYCAEIVALTEALLHVKAHENNTVVHVYTDCLPAYSRHKNLLREISQSVTITLYHVPDHSGIFGNELADFLATRAALIGTPRRVLLTPRATKKLFRLQQLHIWAAEWQAQDNDTALAKWPCSDVGHYLYECRATAHIAERIVPRLHYIDRRYPELLRHPVNRALFILLVRTMYSVFRLAVNKQHNHPSMVTLPDTHPLIGGLFGRSHPVGHMLVRSLTSVPSVSALSRSAGTRHRGAMPSLDSGGTSVRDANGIADVTLRHTRYGLTVFTNTSDTIHNMVRAIQENSVTRASIAVRVPGKRKPHVPFSGVDPDVSQDRFFALLNERNAGLQVNEDQCAVRMVFRERSGTNAFVAEVDPESFQKLIERQRVTLGWTAVRVTEDLHVPTCTFCAAYGHGSNSCPHETDPTKATCMKCAGNHLALACSVRIGDSAVCCAECRRAGRPAEGHPAGFPACPILVERAARIRARTDYGPHQ